MRKIVVARLFMGALIAAALSEIAAAETSLTTLRSQTRELLRQQAVAETQFDKDAAATALCDIYVILRSDDRYATSEMLKGDAAKIRHRLLRIAHHRKTQLRRDDIPKPTSFSISVHAAENGKPAAAAAAGGDSGWELVELIQQLVHPNFWETSGGPGTIRYFALRKLLVVRATSDVHEQIRDLLSALR